MAYSFAHYCPHCRVPSEVYVDEPNVPEGFNSFSYQCPRCQGAVSYSPYRFMRAERIPSDGVVATRCQAPSTRVKTGDTVVCEAIADTVLLPKITKKLPPPSPPKPDLTPSASSPASKQAGESGPPLASDRRSPLSSLGVRKTLTIDPPSSTTASFEPLQEIAALRGHRGWVKTVLFTADRQMVVSGGQEGSIRLYRFDKGGPPEQAIPHLHAGGVQALALASDGKKLAAAATNPEGMVRLWDLSTPKPRLKALLQVPRVPVEALVFSPNGNLLAVGSGNTILLWNLLNVGIREDCVLKGHAEAVKSLAFAPHGSTLASGSQDGTVRLWTTDLPGARELAVLGGSKAPSRLGAVGRPAPSAPGITSLGFSPDGQTVAWGDQDHVVQVWDVPGDKPQKRAVFSGHEGAARLVMFPPDGQTLLSVDDKNCAFLWDLTSQSKTRQWLLPGGATVASVGCTPDGRYLATGTMGMVTVFRLYPKAKNPSCEISRQECEMVRK
jgi:WD40 repeat protein